jgi:hypothetical protein
MDTTTDPYTQWTLLQDDELNIEHIEDILANIDDDLWVASECADRLVDKVDVQRRLLELGVSRTDSAVDQAKASLFSTPQGEAGPSKVTTQESLASFFSSEPLVANLCQVRLLLLQRLDRLHTFEEIYGHVSEGQVVNVNSVSQDDKDGWEDDPWAEGDEDGKNHDDGTHQESITCSPLQLSVFIQHDILSLCFALAANMHFKALETVMRRHYSQLSSHKLAILERIPPYAKLVDYRHLLPSADAEEDARTASSPRRTLPDWVESTFVQQALHETGIDFTSDETMTATEDTTSAGPVNTEEISSWYRKRVDEVLSATGMVDVAIDFVQHGISLGVQGLDEIGEDLTLISRLVYDSPGGYRDAQVASLSDWRSQEPMEIVQEYVRCSVPESIAHDIRRLVLPYLFVLEARADRAGKPDPGLTKRFLYQYVLSTSLDKVLHIFEASKPTLVMSQRLIADDEDLARLALACLYGNDSTEDWSLMSRVFECLPAWSFSANSVNEEEVENAMSALSDFLAPTTATRRRGPAEIYDFFKPLKARSLSRMLDILDVHLESGEILARWNVGVPLHWFLQSSSSVEQQRSRAIKMARQAEAITNDPLSEDEWTSLLDDMLKISRQGVQDSKSAFGLLNEIEIKEIFLSGLLSAGSKLYSIPWCCWRLILSCLAEFNVAKGLLNERADFLPARAVERICLSCSREFYDNANSGNLHTGNMKLAYEWYAYRVIQLGLYALMHPQ